MVILMCCTRLILTHRGWDSASGRFASPFPHLSVCENSFVQQQTELCVFASAAPFGAALFLYLGSRSAKEGRGNSRCAENTLIPKGHNYGKNLR